MMHPYTALPELAQVVLEDSWVIAINVNPGIVEFKLEMVVAIDHPRYAPAPAGKAYTPCAGSLSFLGVRSLVWSDQGSRPSVDAEGRADLGNIDDMVFEGHLYRLEGSWGRMELVAARLIVDYD